MRKNGRQEPAPQIAYSIVVCVATTDSLMEEVGSLILQLAKDAERVIIARGPKLNLSDVSHEAYMFLLNSKILGENKNVLVLTPPYLGGSAMEAFSKNFKNSPHQFFIHPLTFSVNEALT